MSKVRWREKSKNRQTIFGCSCLRCHQRICNFKIIQSVQHVKFLLDLHWKKKAKSLCCFLFPCVLLPLQDWKWVVVCFFRNRVELTCKICELVRKQNQIKKKKMEKPVCCVLQSNVVIFCSCLNWILNFSQTFICLWKYEGERNEQNMKEKQIKKQTSNLRLFDFSQRHLLDIDFHAFKCLFHHVTIENQRHEIFFDERIRKWNEEKLFENLWHVVEEVCLHLQKKLLLLLLLVQSFGEKSLFISMKRQTKEIYLSLFWQWLCTEFVISIIQIDHEVTTRLFGKLISIFPQN